MLSLLLAAAVAVAAPPELQAGPDGDVAGAEFLRLAESVDVRGVEDWILKYGAWGLDNVPDSVLWSGYLTLLQAFTRSRTGQGEAPRYGAWFQLLSELHERDLSFVACSRRWGVHYFLYRVLAERWTEGDGSFASWPLTQDDQRRMMEEERRHVHSPDKWGCETLLPDPLPIL